MIENLVAVAELHATEQHDFHAPFTIADIDQILDRERAGRANAVDALIPCYGAWFGQHLVVKFAGSWVGVDEPVPPRICIGGVHYSPMDAVARRLASETSPSLNSLTADLLELLTANQARLGESETAQNLAYWNEIEIDSKFVNTNWIPNSREEATAALDPWLRSEGVVGKELLCLAAGGGTHAPLFAVAGAQTTVVDFSEKLLTIDRKFAVDFGLNLVTHCCSIEDLPHHFDAKFDIVIQPVSMCYVACPNRVYAQVRRVLRPGGLYISQHKSPTSLQLTNPLKFGYHLEHAQNGGTPLPRDTNALDQREAGAIEYVHSLEQLVGGICRSGFVIEEFCEPVRADGWASIGSSPHRALFSPPYMKIKARRI